MLQTVMSGVSALLLAHAAAPAMAQRDATADPARRLFAPADPAVARSLAPESDPTTVRSRVVRIDLDRLAAARDAARLAAPGNDPPSFPADGGAPSEVSLSLNLFDDVVIPVTIERRIPSSVGYALSGRIGPDESGTVTLVVNGRIVVGTVETTEASYSIRTLGDGADSFWIIRQHDRLSLPAFDANERDAAPAAPEPLQHRLTPVPATPSEPGPAGPAGDLGDRVEPPDVRAPTDPVSDTDRRVSLIEVEILWTAQAAAAAGGHDQLRTEVELMVANANLAFLDGGLSLWIAWDGNPDAVHFTAPEKQTIGADYDFFLATNTGAPDILSENKADYLHLIVSGPKTDHSRTSNTEGTPRPALRSAGNR